MSDEIHHRSVLREKRQQGKTKGKNDKQEKTSEGTTKAKNDKKVNTKSKGKTKGKHEKQEHTESKLVESGSRSFPDLCE